SNLGVQCFVFRSFVDLHKQRSGRKAHFAGAVDIGVSLVVQKDVAADIVVSRGGEIDEPAEGSVVVAVQVGDAQPHRRRPAGVGIVDADIHRAQGRRHWYRAPTWSSTFLNAVTALGNSSGPVTPPVGPPPIRCGSSVAKPS